MTTAAIPRERRREQIVIRGAVQGVGFRPFVYRLATGIGLDGWVKNSPQGVIIEAEGCNEKIDEFLHRIGPERPPLASILSLERSRIDPLGLDGFEIRPSGAHGNPTSPVPPDTAVCPDCLREITDPSDRRYRYPFTNCTNCGPRFSIILSLPYDRPRTTMKDFEMCPDCRREYLDPVDRRFHAQPIACPACGPQLRLWDGLGRTTAERHDALLGAVREIRLGKIVAVKGLGGFHLMVDAGDDDAVVRLRLLKHREEKPFALMYPSVDAVARDCEVSPAEERLLSSPEAPIVLIRRRETMSGRGCAATPSGARAAGQSVARSVAPGNPYLGVMLPYTPLHHLLMRELDAPVVATSGNLSDEPICIDEHEALRRLGRIADVFLVHDRPIRRHVDDSIVRIIAGQECVIRRARGYAPTPIVIPAIRATDGGISVAGSETPKESPAGVQTQADPPQTRRYLAVGAHLKNTIALGRGDSVFLSQHIGDLETGESYGAFRDTIGSFRELYDATDDVVVCDMHPGYLSTQYARENGARVEAVQHHHAHVCSCMAEHGLTGNVLGVSWDGTGYGPDGTVWGGEFLLTDGASFRRVAAFREFPLPGGEKAVREPGRSAIGLLRTLWGDGIFNREDLAPVRKLPLRERDIVRGMLRRRINSPMTTSAGRLFDAVAALLDVRQKSSYEGQAAMELEFLADSGVASYTGAIPGGDLYPFGLEDRSRYRDASPAQASDGRHAADLEIDWGPIISGIVRDIAGGADPRRVSKKFHHTLSEIVLEIARRIGRHRVILTGGCFQNRYLAERTIARLSQAGFTPYWHRKVPPNDGGIALGQVYCAMMRARGAAHVPRDPG